jgi:hypothetical protein
MRAPRCDLSLEHLGPLVDESTTRGALTPGAIRAVLEVAADISRRAAAGIGAAARAQERARSCLLRLAAAIEEAQECAAYGRGLAQPIDHLADPSVNRTLVGLVDSLVTQARGPEAAELESLRSGLLARGERDKVEAPLAAARAARDACRTRWESERGEDDLIAYLDATLRLAAIERRADLAEDSARTLGQGLRVPDVARATDGPLRRYALRLTVPLVETDIGLFELKGLEQHRTKAREVFARNAALLEPWRRGLEARHPGWTPVFETASGPGRR